jgi:ABC-type Fe3+/spermidine/putrescine transport system ATPase subunit
MAIELQHVRKTFPGFSLDLNFSVADGETLVLAGPSGCGKTTALNLIAGLLQCENGRIIVNHRAIDTFPPWKRNISVVFQDLALFPHLNVEKNIAYGLAARKPPARREIVERMLSLVHLEGCQKRKIDTLSGGEKQRVAIARALAVNPAVLLLDEPFSGLDTPLRRNLRSALLAIRAAVPAPWIFVTHDREEARAAGHRIALLKAGKIVEIGTPDELFLRPRHDFTREFFGGDA